MRTHGWSGSAPASDDEAIARILDAAGKAIDARGADFSIADVARTLGVTRQTVYRYFPSTDALLVASAVHARKRLPRPVGRTSAGHHRPRRRGRGGRRHRTRVVAEGQTPRAADRTRAAEPACRVGDIGRRARLRPLDGSPIRRRLGRPRASPTPIWTSSPSICCGSSSRSSSTRDARPVAARNCATTCAGGWVRLYDRQRKRLPRLEHERRAAAEPDNRNLTEFLCRRVGLDQTRHPVRVGTCHLNVEVWVHGGDSRLQWALLRRTDQRRPRPRPHEQVICAPQWCPARTRRSRTRPG